MAFSGPLPEGLAVHHANFLIDKAWPCMAQPRYTCNGNPVPHFWQSPMSNDRSKMVTVLNPPGFSMANKVAKVSQDFKVQILLVGVGLESISQGSDLERASAGMAQVVQCQPPRRHGCPPPPSSPPIVILIIIPCNDM